MWSMSDDRTPPNPDATKSSPDSAKPASGSSSTAKPATAKPATAKPAVPAANSKPAATTPATTPATAPATAAKAPAKPAAGVPKTATAPQPVVSGDVSKVEPRQFRAQPKSTLAAGPPTEAFDPIADDTRAVAGATPPAVPTRPMGPRRARLLVSRLDPWSVMKTAFMLAVSLAIVMLVATAVLWYALDATGVFEAIGKVVNDLAGSGSTNFNFAALVGFGRVMGVALIIAALEIVLTSALSTLFAFLYNLSVGLTGGVEVTLSEES